MYGTKLNFCLLIICTVSTIRGDGGIDSGTIGPVPVTEIVERPQTETEVPPTMGPIGTVPPSTPKPAPVEGCALSPNPVQESEKIVGYRFGEYYLSNRIYIKKI